MAIRKPNLAAKPTIDLGGPQGNAHYLLGMAERLAQDEGRSEKEVDALMKEMMSGPYENLIKVFDREFGEAVDLILPITDDILAEARSRAPARKRPGRG